MLPRQIRYLLAVLDHGNFTRAADALHVSQPALSQQIKQLEDQLGAQLLDRSGKVIVPTDAGVAYAQYARSALRELEAGRRAMHDVEDLTRGELRVGFTPTFMAYLVGPVISAFHNRYPGIFVCVREMALDKLEVAIGDDDIDLGIAFTTVRSPDTKCEILFEETLQLVVGPGHDLHGANQPISASDLSNLTLAMLSPDFVTRAQIDAYFKAHDIAPRVALEANSINAIVEIIRSCGLATILPGNVGSQQSGLTSHDLVPAIPKRTVALLSRKDAYERRAASAFREIARSVVSDSQFAR